MWSFCRSEPKSGFLAPLSLLTHQRFTYVHRHVTIQLRNENEALIRHQIGLIDDLYDWHPATGQ
jgi:hypothetical protein